MALLMRARTACTSRVEQLIQVRRQRRTTVAATEQAEAWAKVHPATRPDAFSDCISLYSRATDMETVSELAELPGTANFYRDKVAALLHLGVEVRQYDGDSTRRRAKPPSQSPADEPHHAR